MSIKSRVWIFQLIVIATIATMAAVTYLGVRAANDHLAKSEMSRLQLEATMQLAVDANRFSEQIAELLLIGEPERPDFESARNQTNAAISNLRSIAREEIDLAQDPEDRKREEAQFDRLVEMRRLFREIDRAAERVLLLDQQGREAEAISVFRSEIENKLDAEFERLIAAAVADERSEAAAAEAEARRVAQWLVIGSLILLASLVVISLGSGYLFTRSLNIPLKALADGALAIERGNLDHRVAYLKHDELGLVAARFNAMVEEMQRQRQALVDARAHLESVVSERTRELGDANRQLTTLDRQRVRFLADVSHELKTPLTVLRGEAEVTLRGASKAESAYRTALANIVVYAADMGRLVDDLLFIARSEADEVRFSFRRVMLPKLVSEAVQEASVLARDRQIDISIAATAEHPIVRADPRRLKQAILAVLDNAVKYAGADNSIQVGTSVANGHGEVCVRNKGTVIPPDELPLIFERFYRGENALRAGSGGSGLGLAIARWIIEKHEGTIDVSSNHDDGTEVRIHLPSVS